MLRKFEILYHVLMGVYIMFDYCSSYTVEPYGYVLQIGEIDCTTLS